MSDKSFAQESKGKTNSKQKVVIERESLRVLAPEKYLFRFHLEPIKKINLNAPMNGTVAQISVKRGDQVERQQQLIRMDDRALELQLEIAKASPDKTAKLEQQLAELRLEQSQIIAPFSGKIESLLATESAFVVAGTPLATLVDDSRLQVTIPMERSSVKIDEEFDLDVEGETHRAKPVYFGSLPEKWDTLRDLTKSVVAVTCELDNSDNKVHFGQSVNSPLVPRHPVAEIPINSLDNGEAGGRIIKIIRDQTVRVLAVKTLGQVGEDRVFVSGLFAPEDELIIKSSQPLEPGTVVQAPSNVAEKKRGWNSRTPSKKSGKNSSPSF